MIEVGWFDVASVRLEGLLPHVNIGSSLFTVTTHAKQRGG
jgi:hypothetical protein